METSEQFLANLRELERSIETTRAEAKWWLPHLLALSGPDLSQELARHPELQPGIFGFLLEAVEETVDHNPARAHELTTVLIEYAGSSLRANAWTAHASALRGMGRHLEALAAITAAHDACRKWSDIDWSTALAKVVEAQILHDMGQSSEALGLIRRGAEVILFYGDVKRYVRVRMYEALILWEAGERDAAAEVWRTMAREAAHRGAALLMAVLESVIGVFQLRHGGAEAAVRLFEIAYDVFANEGLTRDAILARRGIAEAAVARGRLNDAISEYYKVQALALATRNLRYAALASAELVELLVLSGRNGEVAPLADSMVSLFTDAGREEAMKSWMRVRDWTLKGELTMDSIDGVRYFLQGFGLPPNGRIE